MYVADFQVSAARTCSVKMMYQETKFRYKNFPDDQVELLEMPYRGDDITMVIILPMKNTLLSKVTPIGTPFVFTDVHFVNAH